MESGTEDQLCAMATEKWFMDDGVLHVEVLKAGHVRVAPSYLPPFPLATLTGLLAASNMACLKTGQPKSFPWKPPQKREAAQTNLPLSNDPKGRFLHRKQRIARGVVEAFWLRSTLGGCSSPCKDV